VLLLVIDVLLMAADFYKTLPITMVIMTVALLHLHALL